jgi:hypothetical protein
MIPTSEQDQLYLQRCLELASEHLFEAISTSNAVLAEDPRNVRALETKSLSAYNYASRALDARKWDNCEYQLKHLESTGKRKEELLRLRKELERLRPK